MSPCPILNRETCCNFIANLRKLEKRVQIDPMTGNQCSPKIPMSQEVANELEVYGSHGIQAHGCYATWAMIKTGNLKPEKLLGKTISLEEAVPAMMTMGRRNSQGIPIIDPALGHPLCQPLNKPL